MKDKMITIIAHRESAFKYCDKIFELESGKLNEIKKLMILNFATYQKLFGNYFLQKNKKIPESYIRFLEKTKRLVI